MIWPFIICIILLMIGFISLEPKKNIITEIVLLLFMILFAVITAQQAIYNIQDKDRNFNPLYKIDPKQTHYLIYNENTNNYDSIPFGELETYIELDNQ